MNLLFGNSEESEVFWNEILLVRASQYYQLDLNDFKEIDLKVNALYYSFLDLTQIQEIPVFKYHAQRQNIEQIDTSFTEHASFDDSTSFQQTPRKK